MTTYFEEDFESPDEGGALFWAALMNWAGAVVSVALIAGLAVWGYQLLKRDVSGVPVIRALEGPMRVAPEDPGGEKAAYQELTVTEVAAGGAAEEPTERVVLAPAPVELTDEDQPTASLATEESASPAEIAVAQESAVAPPTEEPPSAIELAIAEALSDTVSPQAASGPPERVSGAIGGVRSSPLPVVRPARVSAVTSTSTASAASSAPTGLEVDIAAVTPGTRLVQLGAFPSQDEARAAWDELNARFGEYFEGKQRVVQEAAAGGSTFYRLRAMGFEDLSDARRFCAVLVAESANCIPVIRR